MQPTLKKTTKSRNEVKKDEVPSFSKKEEKKLSVSTPRNYLQKSSTADIYGQRKPNNVITPKTPKKVQGISNTKINISPMKDLLKSSPSSSSHRLKEAKVRKVVQPPKDGKPAKDLPFVNVTVNSPISKRKLINEEVHKNKKYQEKSSNSQGKVDLKRKDDKAREEIKMAADRQRTKTRTLDESEVKILTPDTIDNNKEMLNLSQKLKAKAKAFFVELDDDKIKVKKEKPSDDEISYEDDFESYESDFESYHSDGNMDNESINSDQGTVGNDEEIHQEAEMIVSDKIHQVANVDESQLKDFKDDKDDERMLDSGSYDLRDRSGKTKPVLMEFIIEDSEDRQDKKLSLTDEGFQEMSSSSAVSSLKTVHMDVLDRPLFIDFTKSKENKRKRIINDKLKQRAKDLLSVITLHEMTFSLFEMKPVAYDVYMAIFGRNNYTQTAVQTFDDGINVKIQTDLVDIRHVWTQCPVEFSKSNITMQKAINSRKYSQNTLESLDKFTFLTENIKNTETAKMDEDSVYETNPLRIYFEQKDGVGTAKMLPYELYKEKLKTTDHSSDRLGKFLKKFEGRISNILSLNAGNTEFNDLKNSKLPNSKGYLPIANNNVADKKYSFIKRYEINRIINSHSKSNIILTVSNTKEDANKCIVCLWDISAARKDPNKILIAVDNVNLGLYKGNTDGILVAALNDGSLHLWDLSEEPTWREDFTSKEKSSELVEVTSDKMTEMERHREWNLKNNDIGDFEGNIGCALQSCSYTNSAYNISNGERMDTIVGLEFCGDAHALVNQDGGRKIIGQVATLQHIGILTIWSIIQEKSIKPDVGKAFWSKLKLEKSQCVNLLGYVDGITNVDSFNLSLAKRRIAKRKQEKSILSRPKTAVNVRFDSDSQNSASIRNKKMLPVENTVQLWEDVMLFNDIKTVILSNVLNYIIAKNNGEVLCCRRIAGVIKVEKILVTNDTTSVTSLAVSPHNLPYFLAASESGTVNLCSLVEKRVLLTLDCRNVTVTETERCTADHKGRYISTVPSSKFVPEPEFGIKSKFSISSIQWSHVNPCCFYAILKDGRLCAWDLTHSDIYAEVVCENVDGCVASGNNLILLIDGEIQLHKLTSKQEQKNCEEIFQKYVALL